MAKKRKTDHSREVLVEESREPAAYTVGNDSAGGHHKQQQQQQQQQEHRQQDQQQQQQYGYQQADGYGGDGYDYADEGDAPQSHYSGPVYPGGSRIDPDTLAYLTEVCEALSGMSDPEEAELLRSNVLEEISGKELQLATDAASASLLEQLLFRAPASQLMQFMGAFTDGELFWRCAGAAFGSHVTEKVLAWLHAAAQAAAAADGSVIEGLDTLLDALVSGVEPHIVDYATDKHATHVARALLVVVTGRDVLTPAGKKQRQRQQQQQGGGGAEGEEGQAGGQQQQQQKGVFGKQRSSLAEKIEGSGGARSAARYPDLLRRLVKALPLFDPQQMAQLGKNTYGGPLLQAMLRAAAQDEALLMLLLPPILGLDPSKAAAAAPGQRLATLTDSHVGRLLRDDCYSHLLEVAVAVMPQTATAAPAVGDPAASAAAAAAAGGGGGGDEEGASEGRKDSKKRKADGEVNEPAAASGGGSGKGLSLADEFYERFLKGRLLPLCCHHCANFVIQAALAASHRQSRVAAYVSELSPHLPDLMRRRRSGVVAALAAAAARGGKGPHQQALVAALSNALGQQPQWQGRTGTAHLALALMALDTNAVFGASSGSSGSSTRLSTPGCAMLALLLSQFPPAVVAPFWESMGALSQGDVLRVAKDPSGSRVLEAALAVAPQEAGLSKRKLRKLKKKPKTDGDEAAAADGGADDAAVAARAALLAKLKGSWGALVQTPSGSFLLEAVYSSMAPEQAELLVGEVAAVHSQLLSRCSWGNLVSRKLGLEAYLRSPDEWHKRAAAGAAARKEFEQMLLSTGKQGKPTSAAGAHTQQQQQQQQQDPAGDVGKKGNRKKRSREEGEAATAAVAAGASGSSADANADAAAEDAAGRNAKKRARLAAAALAAAEAADGEDAAAAAAAGEERERKKRKLSQTDAAAAAGGDARSPKKKPKKEMQQGAADEDVFKKKQTKKRSRDSAENRPAAGAGANGGTVDLVALLGFGGLSSDKKLSSKKAKKH